MVPNGDNLDAILSDSLLAKVKGVELNINSGVLNLSDDHAKQLHDMLVKFGGMDTEPFITDDNLNKENFYFIFGIFEDLINTISQLTSNSVIDHLFSIFNSSSILSDFAIIISFLRINGINSNLDGFLNILPLEVRKNIDNLVIFHSQDFDYNLLDINLIISSIIGSFLTDISSSYYFWGIGGNEKNKELVNSFVDNTKAKLLKLNEGMLNPDLEHLSESIGPLNLYSVDNGVRLDIIGVFQMTLYKKDIYNFVRMLRLRLEKKGIKFNEDSNKLLLNIFTSIIFSLNLAGLDCVWSVADSDPSKKHMIENLIKFLLSIGREDLSNRLLRYVTKKRKRMILSQLGNYKNLTDNSSVFSFIEFVYDLVSKGRIVLCPYKNRIIYDLNRGISIFESARKIYEDIK